MSFIFTLDFALSCFPHQNQNLPFMKGNWKVKQEGKPACLSSFLETVFYLTNGLLFREKTFFVNWIMDVRETGTLLLYTNI